MMKCAYHPVVDAVGTCVNCGRSVCAECKVVLDGKIYCKPCADIVFSRLQAGGRTEVGATLAENTSGQGRAAVIPKEIRGWNWGASLLSWIWAIGNKVWFGLFGLIFIAIAFVPTANDATMWIIMLAQLAWSIALGVEGSEWAWRSKRWDSIEHFKRAQSTWAKWGVGVSILSILGFVIGVIATLAGYL